VRGGKAKATGASLFTPASPPAWLWLKQTNLIPVKGQFRERFPQSVQLLLSGNDVSGYFGCSGRREHLCG
jgi:hypothetical protein